MIRPQSEQRGWLVMAELALLWGGVLWLQVVGVVTGTVAHHILHTLPIGMLGIVRGGPWHRHTRAMAGLAWVLMLAVFTPMIWHVLTRGVVFSDPSLSYTWLAPSMVVIAAGWSAASLSALQGRPSRFPLLWCIIVLAGLGLAGVQPLLSASIEEPVSRVVSGQLGWVPILMIEAAGITGLLWGVARIAAPRPRPQLSAKVVCAQLAYWVTFLACMIMGLAVDAA